MVKMVRWCRKGNSIGLPVGAKNKKINDFVLVFRRQVVGGILVVTKQNAEIHCIGLVILSFNIYSLLKKNIWFSAFPLIIFCIPPRYLYGPMALLINGS